MVDLILSPLSALGWTVNALFRLSLVVALLVCVTLAGVVLVKGSQPVDVLSIGSINQNMGLDNTS